MLTKSIIRKFSKLGFSLYDNGNRKIMSKDNKNIGWWDQGGFAVCVQTYTDKQQNDHCPHSDCPMGCYVNSLKEAQRFLGL